MDLPGLILVAVAIAVGIVGTVVISVPGLILVWAAVGVWALVEKTSVAWIVLGFATVLMVIGQVVKITVPGRRLQEAGIPNRSLLIGAVGGIVGFFVIPVAGLIVGFILGIYLSERHRLKDHTQAWPSTKLALQAAGLSIIIELTAGLLIAALWASAVIFE